LKHLLFLFFILSLTACANSDVVNERASYWKNELEVIVPIGTPKEQALKLLKGIDPSASENQLSGNIDSKLETIESNGIPCKNWVITGATRLSNSVVSGHSIATVGRCL
jgi:hypothetical protein